MFLRNIFYSFGPSTRILLRKIWFFPADVLNTLTGKRADLVPPRGMIFTGAGDFVSIGKKYAQKIIEETNLSHDGHVLDIGCGIGRIARPFTGYLSERGAYHGFDIVPNGVSWCKQNYRRYTNFHFDYIPPRNDLYNLSVTDTAADFMFPYSDGTFDVACAISVFTHMQENEVRRYFQEIARTLKDGGACVCTFFIITNERLQQSKGVVNKMFPYAYGNFYLHNDRVKNANVAYKMEVIERMSLEAGLFISKTLPGWWADNDKPSHFDYQDVVVLRKRGNS